MLQTIENPNAAEIRWLGESLDRLRAFAKKPAGHQFSLAELDSAYRDWIDSRSQEDPNPMINSFGTAFGQHLVEHLSMTWSVVTGEQGTEMAVCGQPGDILVFPPNLVAKRFVAKEVGFFETLYGAMARDVTDLRRKAQPRPWWKFWGSRYPPAA